MSPSDNHKPPIKAFLIDLDGTLIGPDERISPRVALAVKRIS
jgi:hydroxymethylpyrimidine pyrophosphatase-like HAD family hydrolase